jgi:hypothetical protein
VVIVLAAWSGIGAGADTPDATAPQTLIAASKAATGGAAWDKITTWHEKGRVAAGGLSGDYEVWSDLTTSKQAQSYRLGPASGGSGWDGTRAWTTDSSKEVRVETSGEAVAQAIQDSYRTTYGFYFPDRFPARFEAGGKKSADGADFDLVKVTPKGADPFEIWFDSRTHYPARMVQLTGAQPHSFIASAWRKVGGVTVPFQQIDRVGDDPKYDTVTKPVSIEFGQPIPASRFEPPPPPAEDAVWPAGVTSVTVPFRLINNHIYVDAAIDGEPPLAFVFDTGATNILEAGAARQLGVKVEGALPGGGFGDQIAAFGLAKVASVAIGGLALHDQVFGTEDAPGWIKVEGTDSAGLLGYEFVKRAVLTVDYAGRHMTFTKPLAFKPPAGVTPIPFTFDQHIPMVEASIDGVAGEFEIDTGSRGALTVMHPFAVANKLIDKYHATRLATAGYGVGGPSRVLLGRAAALTIGTVSLPHPITEFTVDTAGAAAATRTAGNIGGDLLKRFTLTLDYGHQQLWLQPNALAAEPDVFDRSGLWISRADDGSISIDDVAIGSAAAKAGLATGDHITAVNGQKAAEVQLYALREQFKAAVGTEYQLAVTGKGGAKAVVLTLADQV